MTAAVRARQGTVIERQRMLADINIAWLRQAKELLGQIGDTAYAACPPEIAPHRVGGHMRHILEFYGCFLDGLIGSHVDYDARRREPSLETSRQAALARIDSVIAALDSEPLLRGDAVIWVRAEDAEARGLPEAFLVSSIGRELQVLSSHTIHHFALIGLTLRAQGHAVSRNFGMAPSTMRYLAAQAPADPAEAA